MVRCPIDLAPDFTHLDFIHDSLAKHNCPQPIISGHNGNRLRRRRHTHVQSPTDRFFSTVETVAKVGVMMGVWMPLSPDVDKFIRIRRGLRGVENVFERFSFISSVSRCFVPVLLGVGKV